MKIKSNKKIGPKIYKMQLKSSEKISGKPGQFIHLKINSDSYDPLLRRPFSIFDLNSEKNLLTIIYKICGKGTQLMKKLKKGDKVEVLESLGNGFNLNKKNENIILLGGGMGIAPLYFLAKELKDKNNIKVLLGANNQSELNFLKNKFSKLEIEVYNTTMDGSLGFKGTVIELLNNSKINKNEIDYIYSCGPTEMLKELQLLIKNQNIEAEASLEERMGCGVGVCLSCTVKTTNGNMRACKEGPVFPLKEVIFNE
ncbi:MAG: dihydroorotate dehydrogenase electron transfer subunit [Bacillota bacterium]